MLDHAHDGYTSATPPLHEETKVNQQTGPRDEDIGQTLKRLRGETSLRAVQRLSGVSNAYLSQIEKGLRQPGPKLLRRLANLYGVGVGDLLRRAGYLEQEGGEPGSDEDTEVERAYQYVLSDPVFRVGTRPRGPLSTESKRFIVELYERYSGKRLLE